MKHLFLLSLFISTMASAQFVMVECDTVPIRFDTDSVLMRTADFSFGDSMITIKLTNNHPTQGYAYPLVKLVPLTDLPMGMTPSDPNNPWHVFASSWNPGETMTASIYYYSTMVIPDNYKVLFQVWVSNLTPSIPDSCMFDTMVYVNMNSTAPLGIEKREGRMDFTYYISNEQIHVDLDEPSKRSATLVLFDLKGQRLREATIDLGERKKIVDISGLSSGIYFLNYSDRTRKIHLPGY